MLKKQEILLGRGACIQISQEAGKVVWYSHLFQNVPQFIVIHTVKGFSIVNKAEIDEQLRFAGAAVKRYPTSKVRETKVRW